jgi:hypothetical protein
MTSRSHTPLDIQKIQSGWRKRQTSDDDDIQDYVRPWVGLTDEDKEDFWKADQMTQKEWDELFAAIEAKLKEKNT